MGATIGLEQIRQRLQIAKAHSHDVDPAAIDTFVASVRAKYGEEVPVVEAARLLRDFQPVPKTEPLTATPPKTPDGIGIEFTPGGFRLRASQRDPVSGLMWTVFVGVLAAIPFVVWSDLIRNVWTGEGVSWGIAAFLAVWAGAVFYTAAIGAVASIGEFRIAKEGDSGEIFTGIGRLGRTHRLLWSDFSRVVDRDVATYSSGRFSRATHYVGLNGTSKEYKFGSELSAPQRAFIIAFLHEQVFDRN